MTHIKKFNELNENTFSSPSTPDATYKDMDAAIGEILSAVKSGLVNTVEAAKKIKNLFQMNVNGNFPLGGAQTEL